MIKTFFKFNERKTNLSTEIRAGLVTFIAMSYIPFVNAEILSQAKMPFNGVLIATALAAGLSTIAMGIFANAPIGLAPGMGLNAFFTFGVVIGMGFSWQQALSIVLVSGILFLLLSLTKFRLIIIEAIPNSLKFAIGSGIGAFIAFIGLKNSGVIIANPATIVGLGNLKDPAVIITLIGTMTALIMHVKKVKGVILWSMVIAGITGIFLQKLGLTSQIPNSLPAIPEKVFAINFTGFKEIFGAAFANVGWVFSNPQAILAVLIFVFVDIFDTIGTVIPVKQKLKGVIKNDESMDKRILTVDAVGTTGGAILGTSTVTAFIESLTGLEEGGRTGLAAIVTGIMFLLFIFISPLTSFFSTAVTSIALTYVGALMFSSVKNIEWNDQATAFASFGLIITMLLTFAIYWGIVVAFLVYPIIKAFDKGFDEVKKITWLLFAIALIFTIVKII